MASPAGVERPAPWEADAAASRGDFPEPFWRSLFYFNIYRLVVALLLLMSVAVWGTNLWLGSRDLRLFVAATVGYVAFSVACFALISTRRFETYGLKPPTLKPIASFKSTTGARSQSAIHEPR